ncbi:MAG: hypothetical protein PHQ46_11295 [Negativicutes bacterium]|nr:hypothetical protein [Negativicutes bacterium]
MEQSKQLVSRELAERMRELGFAQESYFYWVGKEKDKLFISRDTRYVYANCDDLFETDYPFVYSAFSVAELGEIIKYVTPKDFVDAYMEVMDFTEEIFKKEPIPCMIVNLMTQPDIPAQMLIWLAEQGIINPKEIKI